MRTICLALMLTTPVLAQDSDAPFGDPEVPDTQVEPQGNAAREDDDPEPIDELPLTFAEAIVKDGHTACVATGRVQVGQNVLSSRVRRPTCAVWIDVSIQPDGKAVTYQVVASTTGRSARIVSRPTILAKPGQDATFEQKHGEQDWVRVRIVERL